MVTKSISKEDRQNETIVELNKKGGDWKFVTNVARHRRTRTTKSGLIMFLPPFDSGPDMETRIVNRLKGEGKRVAYRQAFDKEGNPLDRSKVIGLYSLEDVEE